MLYTSAFQGVIMVVVMIGIGVSTYSSVGGIVPGHAALSKLTYLLPENLKAMGHSGFTSMPTGGSSLWWYVITTMIMGVGIGVIGQPQLSVRFMTLKSDRELNRSIPFTALFIIFTTGSHLLLGPHQCFFMEEFDNCQFSVSGNVDKIIPLLSTFFIPVVCALFLVTLRLLHECKQQPVS